MRQQILRGTVLIDTEGAQVGQINGLSVLQMGGFAFGKPTRITARVRMGRGELTDIEREVDMGAPSHSKGVLILSSFLAGRFAADKPLALGASLVFEQSYGGVDGGQRLFHRALRPALGHRRSAHQTRVGRNRFGQPAGPGPGHRRGPTKK